MAYLRPAVIGAGVMGEAIISSLLRIGFEPSLITIREKRPERAKELVDKYGVNVGSIEECDVLLLAIKPQDVENTLTHLKSEFAQGALLVSLLAGVKATKIESLVDSSVRVVRVMPNTPLLISNGMSAIAPTARATEADISWIMRLLESSGKAIVVAEDAMDAVTATSGSGPAYLFGFVEAMMKAAERLGLDKSDAKLLVEQTFLGAALMLEQSGKDAKTLRENVISPKGTTAAALAVFENSKLDEIVYEAMKAARDRSIELSS
jgi:pyrroline-5-carboxylate reductase